MLFNATIFILTPFIVTFNQFFLFELIIYNFLPLLLTINVIKLIYLQNRCCEKRRTAAYSSDDKMSEEEGKE